MKKNLTFALIVLLILSWYVSFNTHFGIPKEFDAHMKQAKEYEEKEIYEDAIAEYEQAQACLKEKKIEIDLKIAEDFLAMHEENDYVSKRVVELWEGNQPINFEKNYVLIDCKNIELNFDTDYIIVEYDKIKECHSNIYNCDFPEIPNNAKVIEFLAYWCMYKMLLRGYKHPVMNLHASQYGTNPYYIAQSLIEEAKRSVAIKGFNEDLTPLWRSAFFISTFDPRY